MFQRNHHNGFGEQWQAGRVNIGVEAVLVSL